MQRSNSPSSFHFLLWFFLGASALVLLGAARSVPSGQMTVSQLRNKLTGSVLTNVTPWRSNNSITIGTVPGTIRGVIDGINPGGYACTLDYSNYQVMAFRHEGLTLNALYIGANQPYSGFPAWDAMTLQVNGQLGGNTDPRITIVFDSDQYTYRFRPTNMTVAYSDSGIDVAWFTHNNPLSTQIPVFTLGVTNAVGTLILTSSNVVIGSKSSSWVVQTNTSLNAAQVAAGPTTTNAQVGGWIYRDTNAYTNLNGITISNMAAVTIPGNLLTNVNDQVSGLWTGKTMDTAENTNEFRMGWGPSGTVILLDTQQQNASNFTWACTAKLTRTGLSSIRFDGEFKYFLGTAGVSSIPFASTNVHADYTGNANGVNNLLVLRGFSRRVGGITNDFAEFAYSPAPK